MAFFHLVDFRQEPLIDEMEFGTNGHILDFVCFFAISSFFVDIAFATGRAFHTGYGIAADGKSLRRSLLFGYDQGSRRLPDLVSPTVRK